jgi:hypothetical protein
MKTYIAWVTATAASTLLLSAAAAAPVSKKMTDQKLDKVVAGWVNPGGQPCGNSKWDCGNNGWGNGYDLNNPGSYAGATEPSKAANGSVSGFGDININPTTSSGR